MKSTILAVLSLGLLVGSLAQAIPVKGYYEVPTSKSDLVNSNKFKIDNLAMNTDIAGVTTLSYVVPEELTGTTNEVVFKGQLSDTGGTLISESGNLNCLMTSKKMMCSATYQKVEFDNILARQKMGERFKAEELNRRLLVQEKFSTDPIGVIHVFKYQVVRVTP